MIVDLPTLTEKDIDDLTNWVRVEGAADKESSKAGSAEGSGATRGCRRGHARGAAFHERLGDGAALVCPTPALT